MTALPPIPVVADASLDAHRAAIVALDDLGRDVSPETGRLYAMLQRRLVVDGLAHSLPVLVDAERQLLFPPPRAFLSERHERRLLGADAVYRYLAVRARLRAMGSAPSVLHPTTPYVVHGMFEALTPSGVDCNAGMIRATQTSWLGQSRPFRQPEPDQCEALLDAAIAAAMGARDVAPIVRAGWLTFTVVTIHPFVDGNGRMCRALAMAAASDGATADGVRGLDPGMLEQWSLRRDEYITTMDDGHVVKHWQPERLDARPFTEFTVRTSTAGARLAHGRLARLDALVTGLEADGLPAAHTAVLLAVALLRSARLIDLDPLGLDPDALVTVVDELARGGLLAWCPRPASRRSRWSPDPLGLALTDRSRDVLARP